MQRSIPTFGLLFTSVSAIIGSGWLFSAFYTATLAGPAATLAWIIGGVFVLVIAFIFAEVCSMLPISGSSARIPQYTHGTLVSFLFAWMTWLSYLALMAAEVQAVLQYASLYFPALTYPLTGQLTHTGYFAAAGLMLLTSAINIYSLRWLIRSNTFLTLLKLIIPTLIVVVILFHFFSPANAFHPANSSFMPLGISGVFAAITSGGIVFAFNGFKQAAEMAGEAKNPGRSIPLAIVGSVGICLVLFLLIQLAFFSVLDTSNLASGWAHLNLFQNDIPLASIISQARLDWLLPFLYVAAVIGPLAAGLMYCSSAGRSFYGMSKNGYLPKVFQYLSPQGNPIRCMVINFILGMCLFAPLPGWQMIMNFLTSLLAISYAVGPITMITLRYQAPQQHRPITLPFGHFWAYLAFYMCTLLAYWNGWHILSVAGIAILLGFAILFIYRKFSKSLHIELNLRQSIWIWPYFAGLLFISYLGNYGGGLNILNAYTSLLALAIFCVFILWLAVKFRLPDSITQNYIRELQLDHGTKIA
jgi:amino acid transporter